MAIDSAQLPPRAQTRPHLVKLYVRFDYIEVVVQFAECIDVPLVFPCHIYVPLAASTLHSRSNNRSVDLLIFLATLDIGGVGIWAVAARNRSVGPQLSEATSSNDTSANGRSPCFNVLQLICFSSAINLDEIHRLARRWEVTPRASTRVCGSKGNNTAYVVNLYGRPSTRPYACSRLKVCAAARWKPLRWLQE